MTSFKNKKDCQKYIKKNKEKYNSRIKPYLKDLDEEKKRKNFESMSEKEKTQFSEEIEEFNRLIRQNSNGWF